MHARGAGLRGARLRLTACALLGAASAALLAWGLWPPTSDTKLLQLGSGQVDVPSLSSTRGQEAWNLLLEYPEQVRVGDRGLIRLRLWTGLRDALKVTPGIQGEGADGATVPATTVFNSHYVIAEARLDLPGAQVRPYQAVSEPLLPGEPAEFVWSVILSEPTRHQGTAWSFLVVVEQRTQAQNRIALSAQSVQIDGVTLLGLGGEGARVAGGLGMIGSVVLAMPFVDQVLRWLSECLRSSR